MTAILVYSRSHFDDQVMPSAAKLSFNLKIEGEKKSILLQSTNPKVDEKTEASASSDGAPKAKSCPRRLKQDGAIKRVKDI